MSYNPRNYTIPNFQGVKQPYLLPHLNRWQELKVALFCPFVFSPEKQSAYIFLE